MSLGNGIGAGKIIFTRNPIFVILKILIYPVKEVPIMKKCHIYIICLGLERVLNKRPVKISLDGYHKREKTIFRVINAETHCPSAKLFLQFTVSDRPSVTHRILGCNSVYQFLTANLIKYWSFIKNFNLNRTPLHLCFLLNLNFLRMGSCIKKNSA